jgi:GH18 family chitinase
VDYEDAGSLTHKALYVRDYRLGGMMFWEYTGDLTTSSSTPSMPASILTQR